MVISVKDFENKTAAEIRVLEAEFFLKQFELSEQAKCEDTLFLLTSYLDAFLFCLISVEEMVTRANKKMLQNLDVFKFFKALRNIATHKSVLPATLNSQISSVVGRQIRIGVGCPVSHTARLFINTANLKNEFEKMLDNKTRSRDHPTIKIAMDFLQKNSNIDGTLLLTETMHRAIKDVRVYVE